MHTAAVIAAAGLSSRMHEFKPMVCLGEDTLITGIIRGLMQAQVEEIIIVTGYKSAALEKHLAGFPVILCENPDYASTKMFDSLCLGLKALSPEAERVFLAPGDVPLVKPETLLYMLNRTEEALRPFCAGQPGHPVLLSRRLVPLILKDSGESGLRGALSRLPVPVTDLPVSDEGVLLDADTPADLKKLRSHQLKSRNGGGLWMDISVQIGRGDTVLEPEGMQLLEMIDHTGSLQSACGCLHMSYTKGWKLLNRMETGLGFPLTERVSGGHSGGGTMLTRRGAHLVNAYRTFRDEIREQAISRFETLFDEELHAPLPEETP